MKLRHVPMAAACALLCAASANATLYSDRTSFEAAAQNLTTTGFEGLIGSPGYPANYPGGSGTWNATSAGIAVDGIKFVGWDSQYGYSTYILAASVGAGAYSLNGSTTLVMNPTSADVTLPTGMSAFGTDFGFATALKKHGPVDVTFHIHDGTTESLTLDTAAFFAYTGKLIDSIHFDARGLHYPNMDTLLLDDVSIGQALAVPEPATLTLMLLGLGVLVSVRTPRGRRSCPPPHGRATFWCRAGL